MEMDWLGRGQQYHTRYLKLKYCIAIRNRVRNRSITKISIVLY